MQEIGLEQTQASILYEDNQGALLMAQAGQPTRRTKHIDIKHFAIQQWVEQDLLTFKRINTADNPADSLTKSTPRTLFYRHNEHIMGKIIPKYVTYVRQLKEDMESKRGHQINVVALNIYANLQKWAYQSSVQGGGVIRCHIPMLTWDKQCHLLT